MPHQTPPASCVADVPRFGRAIATSRLMLVQETAANSAADFSANL